MPMEGSSPLYGTILDDVNLGFSSVFIMELIVKMTALGPSTYFKNPWNQFDCFVVSTSILDLILTYVGASFISFLKIGPQIARIFRVLRVTRLLRLIKRFQDL